MEKTLKEMTMEELRAKEQEAQQHFDKTGSYIDLGEVSYEIHKRQQRDKNCNTEE